MKSRYVFAGIVTIALVLVSIALLQVVSANDPVDETISWTGGGGTSDWGTAANWSPVRVPNTSDKVFIDSGSGVTISSGSQHVIWLHSHKPITISGGTLELDQASLIADNFTLDSSGALTGAGNLDLSGKFTWGWGTMSGTGVTNASGGIDLVVTSTGEKGLYRTLNNKSGSTATYVTGAAYFYIDAPGVFNNESGAIFNWQTSAGGINNAGAVGTFNNAGTLNTTTSAYVAIPFNNTGTVNVTGGDLSLSGGGTHTGSFAVAAGRTLYFAGGTHALNTGGISGEGTARFTTTVNVADGVVLGNASIYGGTTTLTGDVTATSLGLDGAGTLTGAGNLDISGKFTWGWGTMSGTGVTNASGGIDLVVTSTGEKGLYRTLNNKSGSTATYVTGAAYFYIDAPGVFNNESGAIFNWQTSAGGINNAGAVGTFNNAGTLNTTTSAYVAIPFNNTGTVNITSGTLSLSNYVQTAGSIVLNGGSLFTSNPLDIQGGALKGSGDITGNVTIGAVGTVDIELGGTTPGINATDYDQLKITGAASLAGTLKVGLTGGFTPAIGNTFTIMTSGSCTGTFTT